MAFLGRKPWILLTPYFTSNIFSQSISAEFLVLEVQWSNRTYGPDGPWRAITVEIGNPPQPVDMIPGIYYSSTVFSPAAACNGSDPLSCSPNGVYNVNLSNTAITDLIRNGTNSWAQPIPMGGSYFDIADDILIPFTNNFENYAVRTTGISITDNATFGYPKGDFAAAVGAFCLGAPLDPWDFPRTDNSTQLTASVVPNYFADNDQNKTIASGSYGLHLGSVDPEISPSFTYGGYDSSRVVGPFATAQINGNSTASANLTDISIGALGSVADEYNVTTPGGILAAFLESPSPATLSVKINPGQPYLALPKPICDSLTAKLPVTFDSDLGLYIWNTSDHRYPFIVQSPQFLNFSIQSDDGSTVPIAVPFMLLNLTLTPPLVDVPTFYFPCFTASNIQEGYSLGRAFLQSAFFAENWRPANGPGPWFLAQAPGPGFAASSTRVINVWDSAIASSSQTWEQSWQGHFNNATVLKYWQQRLGIPATGIPPGIANSSSSSSQTSSSDTPDSSSSPSSASSQSIALSGGAKAGIAIGAVAGAASLAWICHALWRRKGRQQDRSRSISEPVLVAGSTEIYEAGGVARAELDNAAGKEHYYEVHGSTAPQQLPSTPARSEIFLDAARFDDKVR